MLISCVAGEHVTIVCLIGTVEHGDICNFDTVLSLEPGLKNIQVAHELLLVQFFFLFSHDNPSNLNNVVHNSAIEHYDASSSVQHRTNLVLYLQLEIPHSLDRREHFERDRTNCLVNNIHIFKEEGCTT